MVAAAERASMSALSEEREVAFAMLSGVVRMEPRGLKAQFQSVRERYGCAVRLPNYSREFKLNASS